MIATIDADWCFASPDHGSWCLVASQFLVCGPPIKQERPTVQLPDRLATNRELGGAADGPMGNPVDYCESACHSLIRSCMIP